MSEYREIQKALGLERVVIVQPTGYGFDNTCTLEAMKALGPGARGVSVVKPEASFGCNISITEKPLKEGFFERLLSLFNLVYNL